MKRREILVLLSGATIASLHAALHAQQKAMPVIGCLNATSPQHAPVMAAFRQGLNETGYVEGQNVAIDYRWAEGHFDRLPALAADLVVRKVDAIAAMDSLAAVRAAKSATSTTPIVFMGVSDPVGNGLVTSLARPGGNVTGISVMSTELMPKRLELLSDLVPQVKAIALLVNPNNPQTERVMRDVLEAAQAKGLQLSVLKASTESEIDTAFAALVERHAGALVVQADPVFLNRRDQLAARASRHVIPAIYANREYAASGGLISYGASLTGDYRQAGIYVGRVLKGEKPADLPVQQPTKLQLVINLKTAKALGVTVPPLLLARADEVIE